MSARIASAYRSGRASIQIQESNRLPDCAATLLFLLAELAVVPTIEDVEQHPERQPDHKAQPCDQSQPKHQTSTQDHRDDREPGHERHAERTLPVGLLAPKKNSP